MALDIRNYELMAQAKKKSATSPRAPRKDTLSLIEEAYRGIKQLIYNQQLVPGQRLVYDDLARILNMSRTPVINALNRLEQQGLVVSESFRGFYVKPMDLQEVWDAFGLREAIETYAVELAISKAGNDDFKILEEKLHEHENYQPSYYDRKKLFLDAAFHLQIAEMTGNRVLKYHLRMNFEHVYLRAKLDDYDVDRMAKTPREHRELIKQMRNRNVLGSVETIRKHIQTARSYVIACLSKMEGETDDYSL
jgi:DNA-binding GntR family transcriptional regulator